MSKGVESIFDVTGVLKKSGCVHGNHQRVGMLFVASSTLNLAPYSIVSITDSETGLCS
jgi:hypothetical protein